MYQTIHMPAAGVQPGMTIDYMGDTFEVVAREEAAAPEDRVLVVFTVRPESGPRVFYRLPFYDRTLIKATIMYPNLPNGTLEDDMKAGEYERVMAGQRPFRKDLSPRKLI